METRLVKFAETPNLQSPPSRHSTPNLTPDSTARQRRKSNTNRNQRNVSVRLDDRQEFLLPRSSFNSSTNEQHAEENPFPELAIQLNNTPTPKHPADIRTVTIRPPNHVESTAARMGRLESNVPYRAQATAPASQPRRATAPEPTRNPPTHQDAVFFVPPQWVPLTRNQVKSEVHTLCKSTNPGHGQLLADAISVTETKAAAPEGRSRVRIVAKLASAARFLRGTFYDHKRKRHFDFQETKNSEDNYGENVEIRGVTGNYSANDILRDNKGVIRAHTFGRLRPTRNPKRGLDVTLRVAPGTTSVLINGHHYSTGVHVERSCPTVARTTTTDGAPWSCARCLAAGQPSVHREGTTRCTSWQAEVERKRTANQEQRQIELATVASQETASQVADSAVVAAALRQPSKYARGINRDEYIILNHAIDTSEINDTAAMPLPETETALQLTLGKISNLQAKIKRGHCYLKRPTVNALHKYASKVSLKLRDTRRAIRQAQEDERHAHETTLALDPALPPSRGKGAITPTKAQYEETLKGLLRILKSGCTDKQKYIAAMDAYLNANFAHLVEEVKNEGLIR